MIFFILSFISFSCWMKRNSCGIPPDCRQGNLKEPKSEAPGLSEIDTEEKEPVKNTSDLNSTSVGHKVNNDTDKIIDLSHTNIINRDESANTDNNIL